MGQGRNNRMFQALNWGSKICNHRVSVPNHDHLLPLCISVCYVVTEFLKKAKSWTWRKWSPVNWQSTESLVLSCRKLVLFYYPKNWTTLLLPAKDRSGVLLVELTSITLNYVKMYSWLGTVLQFHIYEWHNESSQFRLPSFSWLSASLNFKLWISDVRSFTWDSVF